MTVNENLSAFFHHNWEDTEGLVYLPTRDAGNKWRQTFFHWPVDEPKIIKAVQMWSAEGKEVFASPVIYKESAYKEKSVAKEHIQGSHVLYADFDGTAPAEWPAESTTALPVPSMRVQTSTSDRQHAYWKLENFETDLEKIEQGNRSLAYQLDADRSGWDISQLLRPPGTINHGYGKEERKGKTYEVILEDVTGRRHPLDFFLSRPTSVQQLAATWPPRTYRISVKYFQTRIGPVTSTTYSLLRNGHCPEIMSPTPLCGSHTLQQR